MHFRSGVVVDCEAVSNGIITVVVYLNTVNYETLLPPHPSTPANRRTGFPRRDCLEGGSNTIPN